MSSKRALVTTNEKIVRERNNDMETKPNVTKVAIIPLIAKQIDTVNKTDKSQASNKKLDTSSSNKYDKGK